MLPIGYLKLGKTLLNPCQYYLKEILTEKEYISHCKKQIEAKFRFNSELIERDFEYLHEVILEQTKTDLSTSTLRRIWSDKHQSVPQTKTLDALAQLLGHSGWQTFKQADVPNEKKTFNLKVRTAAYILGFALLVSSIFLLTSSEEVVGEIFLNPEVEVYEGVPATIGFHYSAKNPNVEIELSWNPYERTPLDMDKDFYTGTYLYPDYHHAKLLHGEQTLSSSPVHVITSGWHGLIMDAGYDINPTYLDSAEFLSEEGLFVKKEIMLRIGEQSGIALPVFTLSHIDLSNLSGDDFTLNAKVKSQAYSKNQTCRYYEVLIKGEKGNIRVPVSQTGCYGLTELKCADKIVSGKQNDLSALSTDLSQEHQVQVRLKENKMLIHIANNPALTIGYTQKIGSVKVIKFIFQGPSEVHSFELFDKDGIPFESSILYPF
ncbi:hypothetical protein [Ekhidna sp. To15]|uniref:hypothetical protein n=1 Tax=Ekhidna sp. To15 TaxID=3395267 RepID=UPI003F51D236